MEVAAADAALQKVKAAVATLLVQIDETRETLDRKNGPTDEPGAFGFFMLGMTGVAIDMVFKFDDDEGSGRYVGRAFGKNLQLAAAFLWIGQVAGLVIAALSHAAGGDMRITNLLAELDSAAHPHIATAAHELDAAARKALGERRKLWPSYDVVQLANKEFRAAESRLRFLLETGPWLP
ncbi:hypothetical protein GCM10009554_38850 [Kribbella koreensis]|uniref:Uncharacterized protein n=1 Tax=Kribbella koreensis TaxID=57909 RepID=A0ABP4B1F2_9ACTN